MIGLLGPPSLGKPWVVIKWQLATGDGLFEVGLLISYTAGGWKSFLSLGNPGLDVLRRVQGHVGPLNDDGLSRNRLEFVAMKEGEGTERPM